MTARCRCFAPSLLLTVSVLASAGCATESVEPGPAPAVDAVAVEGSPPVAATAPAVTASDWRTAGKSVQGRPIRVLAIGHGTRNVVYIGGIHGDEPEGTVMTAELPAAFEASGLADSVTLTIMEDANPDGRAAATRTNTNGVDVNRNFPASNFDPTNPANGGRPLSQPESRVVVQTVDQARPDLLIVAHSWKDKEFINFDGPARDIAERFSAASGLPVEESSSFAPTPGSFGSYFGRDRGIPVLTIEVKRGSDPTEVWNRLRAALLQAIAG